MLIKSTLTLGLLPELVAAYSIAQRRGVTCSFSDVASGGETCASFAEPYGTSVDDFKKLNPGVNCSNMASGDYCVIGSVTDDQPTTTSSTSSVVSSTTTSSAPNTPTQSGTASNCDRFYKVTEGTKCSTIEAAYGISHAQLLEWNHAINSACSNLLADYYICVHVPGTKPPPTTTTTTTTSKAPEQTCYKNKPDPVQPGAMCGCDKWHQVKDEGTTCDSIIQYENINNDDFYRWNPNVDKTCTGLWKGYWVCVHGPDAHKPATTTSKKPEPTCYHNAPTPIQPGAVCNCDKWHRLASAKGTCDDIIKYENIYADDFYKWNPNIGGSACTGIWQGYYTCVHVPGARKPPPPCHPDAPQPVQPGVVCNCKKWHYVKNKGSTCQDVIKYEHVKADDFYKWNPKIGGKACTGLWQGYNVCVGV